MLSEFLVRNWLKLPELEVLECPGKYINYSPHVEINSMFVICFLQLQGCAGAGPSMGCAKLHPNVPDNTCHTSCVSVRPDNTSTIDSKIR